MLRSTQAAVQRVFPEIRTKSQPALHGVGSVGCSGGRRPAAPLGFLRGAFCGARAERACAVGDRPSQQDSHPPWESRIGGAGAERAGGQSERAKGAGAGWMEVETIKQAFLSSKPAGGVCLRVKTPHPPAERPRGKRAEAAEAAWAGASICVGVFATRRIKVDEDLGEYAGEPTRLSGGAKLSCFAFQLNDRLAVDPAALHGCDQTARLSQACITHFVDQPQPQQRCTARFMIDLETSRVTLRSIVEMEEGEEVLASYGGCRPRSEQHAVNDAQCSRFAPIVKLTRTEQQRLSLASNFAAAACEFAADGINPDAGKGTTAAVQVRVVQRVAPLVRRRLVKPAGAARPRTIDRWTREEIEELAGLILRHGFGQWEKKVGALTTSLPGVTRTAAAAAYVWHSKLKSQKVILTANISYGLKCLHITHDRPLFAH